MRIDLGTDKTAISIIIMTRIRLHVCGAQGRIVISWRVLYVNTILTTLKLLCGLKFIELIEQDFICFGNRFYIVL
jgi:hypothetical protein